MARANLFWPGDLVLLLGGELFKPLGLPGFYAFHAEEGGLALAKSTLVTLAGG